MANLYADENFRLPVVHVLRQLGHDVLTSREAGQAGRGIPDPDVLAFAISRGRAVLTQNRRDFIRLHRQIRSHHGIIVCTQDPDANKLAVRIHQALVNCSDLNDQLLRITRPFSP
jgi:predicted nuclease of predicted toxin-antitoxin system